MSKVQRAVCGICFFALALTLHWLVFQAGDSARRDITPARAVLSGLVQ